MQAKVDLSIIILNFNTRDLLVDCIKSIFASDSGKYRYEIIVADNGSVDGSAEEIKKIIAKNRSRKINLILVENKKNLGFAAGNNQGLKKARGRYILFLNSDTKVFKDTLRIMLDYMEENPKVGLATCRVEFADGTLDPASHRGFPTPWNSFAYFFGLEKLFPRIKPFSGYHLGHLDLNSIHEIDTPTGAFYLVRKEVITQVGSFDDRYFMYAEDIDLSLRIKNAGWKIMFVPLTKIIHYKKQSGRAKKEQGKITSSARLIREKTIRYFFDSMKLFYDIHYKSRYSFLTRFLVLGGIWLFTRIKLIHNKIR